MANNFAFDISEIIEDIKKLKEKKELFQMYKELNIKDLQLIISDKPLDVAFWRQKRMQKRDTSMSNMSAMTSRMS